MLGTEIRVVAEGHLQFENRFRSEAGDEYLMQPFEEVMMPFQPPNRFIDGEPGPAGVLDAGEPGERGYSVVGLVSLASCNPTIRGRFRQRIHVCIGPSTSSGSATPQATSSVRVRVAAATFPF